MCVDNTKGEPFALADAFYAECQVVAQFIDERVRRSVDERVGSVPHGVVFQVQMLRAMAWLRSLDKLNHPGDFQAVTAGARSLFEGAVDVTLVHFDPAKFSPAKMDAWEDSAKLKHAQTITAYFAELGSDSSDGGRTILSCVPRGRQVREGGRGDRVAAHGLLGRGCLQGPRRAVEARGGSGLPLLPALLTPPTPARTPSP
jgi:hypothetical protein